MLEVLVYLKGMAALLSDNTAWMQPLVAQLATQELQAFAFNSLPAILKSGSSNARIRPLLQVGVARESHGGGAQAGGQATWLTVAGICWCSDTAWVRMSWEAACAEGAVACPAGLGRSHIRIHSYRAQLCAGCVDAA